MSKATETWYSLGDSWFGQLTEYESDEQGWSNETTPAEPHPSLIEWLDQQDQGFLLTYDTVHPSNPPDWWDIPEDAL